MEGREGLFPFRAAGHHGGRSVGHHGGRASRGLDPLQLPEARLGAPPPATLQTPGGGCRPRVGPAGPPSPLPAAGGERRARVRRPRYLLRAEIPAQVAGSGHGAAGARPTAHPCPGGAGGGGGRLCKARPPRAGVGGKPPSRPRGAGERELMSVQRPHSRAEASSFPPSHGGAGARAEEQGRAPGRGWWPAQRR